MSKKLVMLAALAIIFIGISANPSWADKQRGIHYSEARSAKDAEQKAEAMAKTKAQWEAKKAEIAAERKAWRDSLNDFKGKVDTREDLRARRNKVVNQRLDYVSEK